MYQQLLEYLVIISDTIYITLYLTVSMIMDNFIGISQKQETIWLDIRPCIIQIRIVEFIMNSVTDSTTNKLYNDIDINMYSLCISLVLDF